MIAKSIEQIIGNTPLVELGGFARAAGVAPGARIAGKLEFLNPAGSTKDRAALFMLNAAVAAGAVGPNTVIIEPTSGNTGIGLAALAAVRGLRAIIVMPDSMSVERQQLMRAYGAEVVLTPGVEGMAGCIAKANELAAALPSAYIPGQFDNPANPAAHYATTGPEIWQQTEGAVDVLVAGVGTGGTISGIGRYLKEQKPGLRVVAVEPSGSPVLSEGRAGAHGLQGIGAGFVPGALDTSVYDEVIAITEGEAYEAGRLLARRDGLLVGISSGAAAAAAAKVAARPEMAGKLVVVVFPDGGDKYLSTPLFA